MMIGLASMVHETVVQQEKVVPGETLKREKIKETKRNNNLVALAIF